MDSNSLFTEFVGVFFYHLFAASLRNLSVGLRLAVLLLHAEEAHFTLVEALFRVLDRADVGLQGAQLNQVLHAALFLQLDRGLRVGFVHPGQAGLASGRLGLLSCFGKPGFLPRCDVGLRCLLVDRGVLRGGDVSLIRDARNRGLHNLNVAFKFSHLLHDI